MGASPGDLAWRAAALVFLLTFSAFFSASETALFSLSRSRISRMRSGPRGDRLAARLLEDPQRLLGTIVIGNLFVNVLFASMVAELAQLLLDESSVAVAITCSTALLLVFGEVTPKTLAVGRAFPLARRVSATLTMMGYVFAPIRAVLRAATNAILFVMGQQGMGGWAGITREEVAAVVTLGEAQGVATSRERALLHNILDVSNVEAHVLMVPRTDIRGVEDRLTVAEAMQEARRHRHSMLPVYHEDLDDSWGIFSVVDVFRSCSDELMSCRLVDLRDRIRSAGSPLPDIPVYPALLFPETVRVDKLLDAMRERHASAILLVDEYGGTAGMLTMDDILAEIVGHSSTVKMAERAGIIVRDSFVLAEGGTLIRDFNQIIGASLPVNGVDSLGGFVMERLGRIPRAGDAVEFGDHRFQVIKMAGRRIGTLRVEKCRDGEEVA